MELIQIRKIECTVCGYKWFPRTEDPWKCPRCQHPLNPKRKLKAGVPPAKTDTPTPSTKSAFLGETEPSATNE